MTYYAIRNKEGKLYSSGYAAHNIKFSKNGKMFTSIKSLSSTIKGMLREARNSDVGYKMSQNLNEMKRYISTFTIVEVETKEHEVLTGNEIMELTL